MNSVNKCKRITDDKTYFYDNLVTTWSLENIRNIASQSTGPKENAILSRFKQQLKNVKSTKGPIQTNKTLFNVNDSAYTYPRKIDLLLKLDDTTEVELCSNEWKKTNVSDNVELKQQNKNLQVNDCAITTMSLGFVGNAGYMYRMYIINNIYVATLIGALVIPENPDTFIMFKDTLQLLFGFKYFLMDTSAILKQEVRKLSVKRQLSYIMKDLDDTNHPQHMPYINFPHSKK